MFSNEWSPAGSISIVKYYGFAQGIKSLAFVVDDVDYALGTPEYDNSGQVSFPENYGFYGFETISNSYGITGIRFYG